MRLERLEIAGFGRLRDCRYEFGSQVTVILGTNESGKTTLHRALRAALYGIDTGGQGRPVERSDWVRWQPWSVGPYGVALTYRLEDGRRLRAAHRLDSREARSQVQELGGGDVTDRLRAGRLVSPAQFHLGIDETVFCAAAWLGEEGLRLGASDAASQRAAALQEAIERLADSGSGGSTAAEAVARLRAALARVGSERRATSPLGVAVSRLRMLDHEVDDARRRLEAFGDEEERRRRLEDEAVTAAAEAAAAESAWLIGRLAGLDAQEREIEETAAELAELSALVEAHAAHASFPAGDEDRMIALGGELHQADLAAGEAAARAAAGNEPLRGLRRRRREIEAGLMAMEPARVVPAAAVEEAASLRVDIGVAAAARRRGDALAAAAARTQALRQEIAGTGLGGLAPDSLDALGRLLDAAGGPDRRRQALAPTAGLILVAGTAIAAGAAVSGHRGLALAVAAAATVLLLCLGILGGLGTSASERARREVSRRLPGLELDDETLADLAGVLPGVRRLHVELGRQHALAEAHRAELEVARRELEDVVARCCRLAHECGVVAPARPPLGSSLGALVGAAGAALDGVTEAAAEQQRRRELEAEDTRLAIQERQLAELVEEADHRRRAAIAVEGAIREVAAAAGLDSSLPPLAAVAAFRDACQHRCEYERTSAALAEVRRRHRLAGSDVEILRQRRREFAAELSRRGRDASEASAAPPLDGRELAQLEAAARAARDRAAAAAAEARALGARLEGLTASLPSLADLEDERSSVAGARNRAVRQAEALRRAITLIDEANQRVHRDLAPRLAASVANRLTLLTESRYRDVNIDTEHFAVSLLGSDRPELVPLEQTSHGTRDQVSLLLRIALCEVLGDAGEPVPLLLDEPLLSADLTRRRGLLEFLARVSETNQVVMTTSDPTMAAAMASMCPAEKEAATVIDLDAGPEQPALDLAVVDASGMKPVISARMARRTR